MLLLHNPDRRGYESEEVWEALRAVRDEGLAGALGLAPGPANGFTLDTIGCFERYGELIDWAMLILNPFEPWPGELALAAAARHDVRVITRVVDYGGLFHDDVLPGHELAQGDHRGFRPEGWVEAGRERLDRIRPIADRHGLTMLQLACAWNLSHEAVACVAPTLIQEPGPDAKPIEAKRAELAAVPSVSPLSAEEVEAIRAVGDNTGSMLLKGATPDHEGDERPDRWTLEPQHVEIARRWGIEPERDLRKRRRGLAVQQLAAALEGVRVLRAGLVETVRVGLEVVGVGRVRRGAGAVRLHRSHAGAGAAVIRRRHPRPGRPGRRAGCCRPATG